MVWLEYEPKNTFFHNSLNALTKFIITLSILLLTGFFWDLRYLTSIFIIALLCLIVARIPLYWYKNLLIVAIMLSPVTLITGLWMVKPEYFKVLPPELVSKVVIEIIPKDFPVFGGAALTYGNLYWGVALMVKIVTAIMAVYLFTYTTSLSDFSHSLQKVGIPSTVTFLISCAYRFVPILIRKEQTVMSARRLRGWKTGRNPIKVIHNLSPIFYSLGSSSYKLVEQLTMALALKGFKVGQKGTPTKELKFSILDYTVSIVSIIITAMMSYLVFVYQIGQI